MHAPTPNPQPRTPNPRPGFTLTELLVVIAIIAMLVALVSVGVMRALDTAKQSRMKIEVDQLDAALKSYKEKYGSYPPCDLRTGVTASLNALKQHVARAFPRYDLTQLTADMGKTGVDTTTFRPDQALVFWLRGFGPDPQHPFVTPDDLPITNGTAGTVAVKRSSFYDFDTGRLAAIDDAGALVTDKMPSYFPAGIRADVGGAPYVYFDADNYGTGPIMPSTEAVPNTFAAPFAAAGVAAPYWHDANGNGLSADFSPPEKWANPDSFQIIASGNDGKFGFATEVRCYPTGTRYDTSTDLADDDNVTNFCEKARLEDAKP